MNLRLSIGAALGVVWFFGLCVRAEGPDVTAPRFRAVGFERREIYHSPERPGYSAWCTLWRAKGGEGGGGAELRLAFQRVTGAVGKPEERRNVTVVMGGGVDATTWTVLRDVPARAEAVVAPADGIYASPGSSSVCGHAVAVLGDGTMVTGLWGAAGHPDESGYVRRSTDEGATWSGPIFLVDPKKYLAYPTQVRGLRDGRVVCVAGVIARGGGKPTSAGMRKAMFVSVDGGRTWGEPVWLLRPEEGVCEESDFVELASGDLLFVHRAEHYEGERFVKADRVQSVVRKRGDAWEAGPGVKMVIPHSGFPELLKTREGVILHVGTDGVWSTSDEGKTWGKTDVPGSPYYPRAVQLADGRILVVGHVGSDDVYGKVDQTVVMQTFRLEGAGR